MGKLIQYVEMMSARVCRYSVLNFGVGIPILFRASLAAVPHHAKPTGFALGKRVVYGGFPDSHTWGTQTVQVRRAWRRVAPSPGRHRLCAQVQDSDRGGAGAAARGVLLVIPCSSTRGFDFAVWFHRQTALSVPPVVPIHPPKPP